MAVMVQEIAGGKLLPSELNDHIINHTDGIPLFIEEVTKNILGRVCKLSLVEEVV
jgi:predicted ATPase